MYKNQLQELAQRSCFNLPSYTCIREGPDHAPRFKAAVNFNGEVFESPSFCTTLRQAEHSAAEVALTALSHRGPSHSLAARILDETGVYKNLLQEISQRVGAPLPSYTSVRSGLGHLPVFTCTVELAGITFWANMLRTRSRQKKMLLWQHVAKEAASSSTEQNNDEQEQITIARALLNYRLKEKIAMANNPHATPFPKKFPVQLDKKPASLQSPLSVSKILPLIRQNSIPRGRATSRGINDGAHASYHQQAENHNERPQNFPVAAAAPYFPVRPFSRPCHGMAPPVTIRTAVPVFSAPPLPPPPSQVCQQRLPVIGHTQIRMASPVRIRQSVPVFSAPPRVPPVTSVIPVQVKEPLPVVSPPSLDKDPVPVFASALPVQVKESVPVATASPSVNEQSPVTAPAVPVLVKEPLSSIQAHEPSVLLLACPAAKPSSQIEDFVDSRDAKDLEESESTAMESLKRLEIC
ncbi:Chorismate synthase [Musa troglodytarum]|uniref:Chorismate synthase n=1 Tax=Musa troglodytarum TaxID=320322 RepID=A0A9E7EIU5_9LILI|nr:Chorismate synthase [Musa troglodytarum]URD77946.1 Chorismate synthase [Musa troglodytarum]URD77951.1 Chorismate synthase [Musa troglodytarum]